MKHAKDHEFETTIFDVSAENVLPHIINMGGKYDKKCNIKGQWIRSTNGENIHIHQEGREVVVEHKTKIPNTHNKILSYQGTSFVTEDFHKIIYLFIRMGFSPHREQYNRFRYTYVSGENPEIGKVSLNFDTYEIGGEKLPLVLKIVAKTEKAIINVTELLELDASKLNGIEPIHILDHLYPEIKNI